MKPLTRKEILQAAIARGEVPKGKPLTRSEIFMTQEAEREASGGGGVVKLYAGETTRLHHDKELTLPLSKLDLKSIVDSDAGIEICQMYEGELGCMLSPVFIDFFEEYARVVVTFPLLSNTSCNDVQYVVLLTSEAPTEQ